jgi:hypothetical protein
MKYQIGLECGGLMECEGSWELHNVREIEADSLNEAKDKWAAITATDQSEFWDAERRSDWGFQVMEVDAFIKAHGKMGSVHYDERHRG